MHRRKNTMELTKCLVLLIIVLKVSSAAVLTPEQMQEVQTFIDKMMECRGIPGLSLAVVRGNDTWLKGFGIANKRRNSKVTPDTLFGIGSVTKAMTVTLLGMLLDEHKNRFNWTTKVKDIIGDDFRLIDDERTKESTLRDFLTHRTGLQANDMPLYAGFDQKYSRKEIMKRLRFLPAKDAFRDTFLYNNWAYTMIGHVIEVLAGASWEDTMQKRIFDAIGMTQSRIIGHTVHTTSNSIAKPYFLIDDQLTLTDPEIYSIHPEEPAGAVASSAVDMSKWLQFLLNVGKTSDNQTLIQSLTLKETFKTHEALPDSDITRKSIYKPIFPVSNIIFGYGYAWFNSNYKGYRKTFHTGGLHSYITYLTTYPDLGIGIFTSTNGPGTIDSSLAQQAIHYFVTDLLIGDTPWLDETTGCSFPSPWLNITTPQQNNSDVTNNDVVCMDCYTGTYGQYLYGNVVVKIVGGSLELHYGHLKGSLNSTNNKSKFKIDVYGPLRLFSRPGNSTNLIEIEFKELQDGKYEEIVINFQFDMVFKRSQNFDDTGIFHDKPTTTKPSINGGITLRYDYFMAIAFVIYICLFSS